MLVRDYPPTSTMLLSTQDCARGVAQSLLRTYSLFTAWTSVVGASSSPTSIKVLRGQCRSSSSSFAAAAAAVFFFVVVLRRRPHRCCRLPDLLTGLRPARSSIASIWPRRGAP